MVPTMTDAELEEIAIEEYAEDACYGDMEDARAYWPNRDEFDRRVYYKLAARRIPEGSIVLPRNRVERLLKGIDVLLRRIENEEGARGRNAITNVLFDPGDLDPL